MANLDTSNLNNLRIELAVLQETINKYNPPLAAKFTIPALMGDTTNEKTVTNTTNNILNKTNDLGITKTTTSNYIEIPIPKEYLIFYPEKYIPKGTTFIAGFVGGDITTIKIIGRF